MSNELQLTQMLAVFNLFRTHALFGEETGFNSLGEINFHLGVKKRDLSDLLQVVLDRVSSSAGGMNLLNGRIVLNRIRVNEALIFRLFARCIALGISGFGSRLLCSSLLSGSSFLPCCLCGRASGLGGRLRSGLLCGRLFSSRFLSGRRLGSRFLGRRFRGGRLLRSRL